MEALERELVYLWYYVTVQLEQIFGWWVLGMLIGSAVSVFAKDAIHRGVCLAAGEAPGDRGRGSCKRFGDRLAVVHVRHHPHRGLLFEGRHAGQLACRLYDELHSLKPAADCVQRGLRARRAGGADSLLLFLRDGRRAAAALVLPEKALFQFHRL